MTHRPKILAIAGSLRQGSYNKKLLKVAAAGAIKAGADVAFVDLRNYPLPLYDGDLEEAEGIPAKGRELKKLFIESDGLLIASPEYNSSIPGGLKNAIDWVSRPEKTDPVYLAAFRGKAVALMSASPSPLGGLRGLVHLRALLGNVFSLVLPDQVTVSQAQDAFNEEGVLKDPALMDRTLALGAALTNILIKLDRK